MLLEQPNTSDTQPSADRSDSNLVAPTRQQSAAQLLAISDLAEGLDAEQIAEIAALGRMRMYGAGALV